METVQWAHWSIKLWIHNSAINCTMRILVWHWTQHSTWQSQALFFICANQYLEFCGKLFWTLLSTCNVVCSMDCMMVLAMLFLSNEWYQPKICVHHCCVSIKANTRSFHVKFCQSWSMHIGLPSDCRIGDFNCCNMCHGWIGLLYYWSAQIKL